MNYNRFYNNRLNQLTGAMVAVFQLPPLPGSRGLPIQFVIKTTDSFQNLNEVSLALKAKALESGMFLYLDSDLKIDKAQTNILLNRDKAAQFGLTMQDISNSLGSALSQGYINYFNFAGRSYQVIPQMTRNVRQNADQVLDYYLQNRAGTTFPLSTLGKLQTLVMPESITIFNN